MDTVWAVGSDRLLKELELPDLTITKELDGAATLGQIALTNAEHAMFAGTSQEKKPGCVRAYAFPLTGEYLEYPCMGGPITRMRVSHNDQYLFVADETGCLCVFSVKDKNEKRSLTGKVRPGGGADKRGRSGRLRERGGERAPIP